jgi:cardiolipin synthase A/B
MTTKRKIKKKKHNIFLPLKKSLFGLGVAFVLVCTAWISDNLQVVTLPVSGEPTELYANQANDDLRKTFLTALEGAKHSILLIIYTLTDDKIIEVLKRKSEQGVTVEVIIDAKESIIPTRKLGSKVKVTKRIAKNIMHQKLLVIDGTQTLVGSANMTSHSFRLHGNLVAAIENPEFAEMVMAKAQSFIEETKERFLHRNFEVGGQNIELWFLPDNSDGVRKMTSMIHSAQKCIKIAMFTWTRHDFAKAVIQAHQRGVHVEVALDQSMSKGASSKIFELLTSAGIPVFINQGIGLLHHKFLYIDKKILINGSANWTQAAFTKNDDCFIIIHDLNEKQTKHLEKLWETISLECKIANAA